MSAAPYPFKLKRYEGEQRNTHFIMISPVSWNTYITFLNITPYYCTDI